MKTITRRTCGGRLLLWFCVLAQSLTGCLGLSDALDAPHVVFLIGEREYRTAETLPAFARSQLDPLGVRSTFVHVDPTDSNSFPGLEVLDTADLLVLSLRRRALPAAQIGRIRNYLDSGKPLVGIRTASHGFDNREPPPGGVRWQSFDVDVLGHKYNGHYGNKPPKGKPTFVKVLPEAEGHPIVEGLPRDELRVWSHLYKVHSLAPTARALLSGHVEGELEVEPVATTNTYRGGRIFYTSLGSPLDFEFVFFRRLLVNAVFWAMEMPVPERPGDG